MEKYIKLYLDTQVNSKNTRISYKADLKAMADYIGKPVEDITEFDLIEWKQSMSTLSSATVARRLGSAKRFFTFLYDNNYIDYNPSKAIKPPRITNREEDTLTRADVDMLIQNGKNPRDKAIIALMASTGLRVSELCNIKVNDIDEDDNIKILGKGSKWRIVHINPKTKKYINDYLKVRKNSCDALFVSNHGNPMQQCNIDHTLKTLGRRIGVSNIHPHMLRHYFATAMLDNNVPINQISMVMGHSNITTTQRYAKIRDKKAVTENVMNIEIF